VARDADVVIVDYGVGNLRSVQKAIEHGGHTALVTSDPNLVADAERVILPGVGAFGAAITKLRASGLDQAVFEVVGAGKLLLGICVGMQLLMSRSFEQGEWEGLGLIPGDVVRFDDADLKVPQIGWNTLDNRVDCDILRDIPQEMMFYFVHSYYCQPEADATAATTEYGNPFTSVISRGNILAAQFHPEKSGQGGLRFLKNFAEMAA
jgi:glutamine amidotransferase